MALNSQGSRKSSVEVAPGYLQETGGNKAEGPASKAKQPRTARRHMARRLRKGESASARPHHHGSVIKSGVNMELHKTSQCGVEGDPPHVALHWKT